MKCEATTAAGKPCRAKAKAGERYCSAHLGTAHRPTKLTPEMEERILAAVRAGSPYTTACQMAGIHRTTLASWRERAEAGHEPYAAFIDRLNRARGEGQTRLIALIAKTAAEDWRAAAWILERTDPDNWAKRERFEHTGRDGGPIEVADGLQDPEVRRRARELIARIEAARSAKPGGSGSSN